MTTILIADEHEVVRHGLRLHLESQPNWQVVGEAANGNEAILNAINTNPDVVVLAYKLPIVNGIEATRQIRAQLPKTEVLIYTMHSNECVSVLAKEAGALGCVLKSEPISNLIRAVQCAAARMPYRNGRVSRGENPQGAGSPLTNREREIVEQVAHGHTNTIAARNLGIDKKTVETHRVNIMHKLELTSSAQLVRYAVKNGLAIA